MSVYYKENPEYFKASMDSIWNQSYPTNDFVLVCDGPLTSELDSTIKWYMRKHPEFNVVRLEKNGGLGRALNKGLQHCKNELVARMDSDDIAYPDRCGKQIAVFNTHSEVSICSGIVEEFTTDPNTVDTRRVPPETNAEIIEFAKKRNRSRGGWLLPRFLSAGGLLPLASNADGRISGLQHSRATAPYESRF